MFSSDLDFGAMIRLTNRLVVFRSETWRILVLCFGLETSIRSWSRKWRPSCERESAPLSLEDTWPAEPSFVGHHDDRPMEFFVPTLLTTTALPHHEECHWSICFCFRSHDPSVMDDFYAVFKSQNQIPVHLYRGRKGKKRNECLTNAHDNKDSDELSRSTEHHDLSTTMFWPPLRQHETCIPCRIFLCFQFLVPETTSASSWKLVFLFSSRRSDGGMFGERYMIMREKEGIIYLTPVQFCVVTRSQGCHQSSSRRFRREIRTRLPHVCVTCFTRLLIDFAMFCCS